jgi:hypothetical protein
MLELTGQAELPSAIEALDLLRPAIHVGGPESDCDLVFEISLREL